MALVVKYHNPSRDRTSLLSDGFAGKTPPRVEEKNEKSKNVVKSRNFSMTAYKLILVNKLIIIQTLLLKWTINVDKNLDLP